MNFLYETIFLKYTYVIDSRNDNLQLYNIHLYTQTQTQMQMQNIYVHNTVGSKTVARFTMLFIKI